MKRFFHFIQYNNAFVIILVFVFGGATATFAANENARDAVFSSSEKVIAVDNTYLLSQNVDSFGFDAKVIAVKEDTEKYYVDYEYKMIEIVDYVWKDIVLGGTLTFSKRELIGKDLGLKVADELSQLVSAKKRYLAEVQKNERNAGESQKIVTVEYSGLVGRLLSSETKAFPGYDPRVKEEKQKEDEGETLAAYLRDGLPYARTKDKDTLTENDSVYAVDQQEIAEQVDEALIEAAIANTVSDPEYPVVTVRGEKRVRIEWGSPYYDDGALVKDTKDGDALPIETTGLTKVNTKVAGTYLVKYKATDSDGHTTEAGRAVTVFDPLDLSGSIKEEGAPEDTTPPVLHLTGFPEVTIEVGNRYSDPGATVTDDINDNLGIRVDGLPIDTNTAGTYVITYYAFDASGNKARPIMRTVTVVDPYAAEKAAHAQQQREEAASSTPAVE